MTNVQWPADARDARRRQVADLHQRGQSQRQIAATVGISQAQVYHDLQVLNRAWRMASLQDFDKLRSREMARIDHLEQVYWEAWASSLKPREITVTEQRTGPGGAQRAQIRTEMSVGDPRFLVGVQWCIDRRCRLFGLDAPPKVTMEIVDAEAERIAEAYGLDKRVVVREVEELLALQAP